MAQPTRSILITGATSGLGLATATEIARLRPHHRIVIASRKDPDGCAAAINQKLGQNNVEFMPLDLAQLDNVRAFVKAWGEKNLTPISELLLNAGLQFPGPVKYTADGVEATFAITHLGHALLFYLLQPYLADDARIVITASGTHDPAQKTRLPDAKYISAEEIAHPTKATINNPGRQRYTEAKLCNILWTYALHRRLAQLGNKKWTVVAFDPGLMPGTGLARDSGIIGRFVFKHVFVTLTPLIRMVFPNTHSPKESGAALAYVTLDKKEHSTSGVYYEGRQQIKSSVDSYHEEKQEDLWDWTRKFLATNDAESRAFQIVP